MEGITYLERSALGVSLDSRPTEGAPCLEPLEQSVLSSSLAAPVEAEEVAIDGRITKADTAGGAITGHSA